MRFSLRSLFFLMAGVAVYCALLFAGPSWLSVISMLLLTVLTVPVAVGGAIYAKDSWRAFWIGCAVGVFPLAFTMLLTLSGGLLFPMYSDDDEIWQIRIFFVILHGLILLNGAIVCGIRGFCIRGEQNKTVPVDEPPVIPETRI